MEKKLEPNEQNRLKEIDLNSNSQLLELKEEKKIRNLSEE